MGRSEEMKLVYLVIVLSALVFSLTFYNFSYANETEDNLVLRAIIDVKVFNEFSFNVLEPDEILEFAYESGKEYNLGETLRAITYLESGMGRTGRVGDRGVARGITQIQIPTAKFILKKLMKIKQTFSDQEIKKLLTYNDKVCIILSKEYLVYLMDKFKNRDANWSHGLLSYNIGPNYVKKAKKFIIKQRGS